MKNELDTKIELIEAKMSANEPGSVPFIMYKEIRDELVASKNVRLHIAEEAICESCQ